MFWPFITGPDSVKVKTKKCDGDGEYIEGDCKMKLDLKEDKFDVQPEIERDLLFEQNQHNLLEVIKQMRARNEKRVLLTEAREKELLKVIEKKTEELVVLKKAVGYWKEKAKNKTLGKEQTDPDWMTMEELQAAEEEKNKDNSDYEPEKLSPRSWWKRKRQADSNSKEEEDFVELRQSVKHWKKKAESRSNKIDEQVEQQSQKQSSSRVQNVKTARPPCRQSGEVCFLVHPPGEGDTATWEEQEGAGEELEEEQGGDLEEGQKEAGGEQGEQKGDSSRKLREVRKRENRSHRSEFQQGRGGIVQNVCSKSFLRPKKLKAQKPFSCDKCAESFSEAGTLNSHKRSHSGVQPYSCDECPKSFARAVHLKRHKVAHSGVKPYSCDKCLKSFAKAVYLKRHKVAHSGVKPYSCDECPMSFARAWDLKRHKHSHSGEKPYSCNKCPKSFSLSWHLKSHKLKHSGEKPYTCDECPMSFARAANLKDHMMTHFREKAHMCRICNKGFNRPWKFKVHKLKHNKRTRMASELS